MSSYMHISSFIWIFADSLLKTAPDIKKCQEALSDTQAVVSDAINSLSPHNIFRILIACAMLIFIISPVMFPVTDNSLLSLHHAVGKILYLVRVFTTVILSGFLFYLIFNVREEYSVYKSVHQMVDIQIKQISPRKRMKGNSCL